MWWLFFCVLVFLSTGFYAWKSRHDGAPTAQLPADLKPEDIDWLRRHFEMCEGRGITMALPRVALPRVAPVVGGPGGPPKGRGAGSLPVMKSRRTHATVRKYDPAAREIPPPSPTSPFSISRSLPHTDVHYPKSDYLCNCWECRNVHDKPAFN